jgi:6,7-dimethyl-8-ribityllumazine synthase
MSQDQANGDLTTFNGSLVVPEGARFALVAGRFNTFVVERLIDGAIDALTRHGCPPRQIVTVRVPGSWEIPVACRRLAHSRQFDGIVALGAVIRGGTPHFEYVATEVTKGIAAISLDTGIPIGFGVLTTDNIEQAIERAGTKAGNKGFDAALATIEMVSLGRTLGAAGY